MPASNPNIGHSDRDIDLLLDEANEEHKHKQRKLEAPEVKSASDFDNPFFVVVHENVLDQQKDVLDPQEIKRVKQEIDHIKSNYDYVTAGPFLIPSGLPDEKRPILVCGAFDTICVFEQYQRLAKRGYDVYISKEGTLSFSGEVENSIEKYRQNLRRIKPKDK